MNTIILLLLLAHLLSIIIMELVIYSFPFEYQRDWKRTILIGTPINIFFNVLVYFGTAKVFFSNSIIYTVKNLLIMNCSFQDIEKLASSCLVSIVISLAVSGLVYKYVRKQCYTVKKFRFASPLLILVFIAAVPIMVGYQIARTGDDHISINEVCRKTTTNAFCDDPYADDDDLSFVVIKNDGEIAFDADKLFLSDNEEDLQYFNVNGGRINPGETYTCLISGDEEMNIKKKGGSIVYLSNVEGKILDNVVVPALARNESYQKNGEDWEIVSYVDGNIEIDEIAAPVFSSDSGFYEDDFFLSLSTEDDSTIYYTLDCSDPTIESECYNKPIHVYDKSAEPNKYRSVQNVQQDYKSKEVIGTEPVDKAFVVRAMAVDREGHQSKTITKTYWINLEKYRNKNVISLVTDPKNLFDEQTGIYVNGQDYEEWYQEFLEDNSTLEEGNTSSSAPTPNFKQRGEEWEREANCEIISGTRTIIDQPVGIRIQGATSRAYALKRFSVYSRKQYSGSKWFEAPIINDNRLHSFVLRSGLLNAFIPALVEDRDIGIQHVTPVDVFLDGEYWYSVYLQEKYSNSYFNEHFQVNTDNIQLVKNKTDQNLLHIIEKEYSSDEEAYSQINSVMDIQSYIDFICVNTYVDNEDMYEEKNCLSWKSYLKEDSEFGDTRWRWLLYDMDLAWNFELRNHDPKEIPYQVNSFSLGMAPKYLSRYDFTLSNQPLYKGLRKNSIFCRNFVLSFMDIANTDFRKETVLKKLEEWGNTNPKVTDFFTYRADYIIPYMAEEFELKGTQEIVTLASNRSGSPITLNTIQPTIQGEWSGTYFTDYPVTVSVYDEGFDHWEITANGITKKYYETTVEVPVVKGGIKINAIFK
ncbi:CotH kinase family protein [Butyrivibrio sp. MC2021]|uniref:CotH kinase family protein n=1 Tax=Butyrivibrio sp. MC2021 TaxID=1408306 RepID=UPI00047D1D26|nr:CotH kinase family protein [Butyrivibrio sp. MC2021]